jgi:RimJ/RimL family protein N-acetyltransferase
MRFESGSILGEHSYYRPVQIEDAQFILDLRSDPKLNKYISATPPLLEDQEEWIKRYFERNLKGKDYYFIACDLTGTPSGTVRVYDVQDKEATGGSWVVKPNSSIGLSLESFLVPMYMTFEILGKDIMNIDVRMENKRVLRWHEMCGALFIKEDQLNKYYNYDRNIYNKSKSIVGAMLGLSS